MKFNFSFVSFGVGQLQFQGKPPVNDLKTVQTREAVQSMLEVFVGRGRPNVKKELITRLKYIRQKFQESSYFQTHEVNIIVSLMLCLGFFFFCSFSNIGQHARKKGKKNENKLSSLAIILKQSLFLFSLSCPPKTFAWQWRCHL